ncbi:hypothetical protein AMTRI_Chr01g102860 [Amborella trichopoda]
MKLLSAIVFLSSLLLQVKTYLIPNWLNFFLPFFFFLYVESAGGLVSGTCIPQACQCVYSC